MVCSYLVAGLNPERAIQCSIISSPGTNFVGVSYRKGTSEHMTLPKTENLRVLLAPQLYITCSLHKLKRYSFMYLFIETDHKYLFRFHEVGKQEK